uniref:Cytochrome c oxidase subunit 2 n=1 Tax=Sphaerothecum destruens TaxID=42893 RepID=A0A6H2U2A6_9EUKA|nr:cytochrome c oxidase subunit II [Sphaerothecum destruens]QID02695.1 cytochrome c oxidase subunit II [Sphaerothecum destruens]
MIIRDIGEVWQLGFQDPASWIMLNMILLHDKIFFYMIVILTGVFWILSRILMRFRSSVRLISHRYLNHGTMVEMVWTVLPVLVLVIMAFPSFKLLYLMDEIVEPGLTVKVIGRQWYWVYEYSDYVNKGGESLAFDSYMIPVEDLGLGDFRLMEVDNSLVVPRNVQIRLVVTASDVIHSWAVPSLGIKLDAIPGRLNQVGMLIPRLGLYYGLCSEICGTGHSSMPIVVKVETMENYVSWVSNMMEELDQD